VLLKDLRGAVREKKPQSGRGKSMNSARVTIKRVPVLRGLRKTSARRRPNSGHRAWPPTVPGKSRRRHSGHRPAFATRGVSYQTHPSLLQPAAETMNPCFGKWMVCPLKANAQDEDPGKPASKPAGLAGRGPKNEEGKIDARRPKSDAGRDIVLRSLPPQTQGRGPGRDRKGVRASVN